jgi:hypothetical protein
LNQPLQDIGLVASVFIWDDFHDRYLITDLIGLLMGNGFDITKNPDAITTWARISREDREKIQREFDYPNNVFHKLYGIFKIGRRD